MDRQMLINSVDESYDFLKNINLTNANDQYENSLHPLIKFSTIFSLDSVTGKASNRLAIVFPKRFQSSVLISVLCGLGLLKEKNEVITLKDINIPLNQKVLLNGCLVEYAGKKISINKIIVKCRDGNSEIPFNAVQKLDVVWSEKQLDKMEELSYACFSGDRTNVLNKLLKVNENSIIRPVQNIMLISRIGETEKQIDEVMINGVKASDLFSWGKVTSEGEVSVISAYQTETAPVALVAADYYRASYYLENYSDKTELVIMDGLSGCVNNLQILDDEILAKNITAIVILDLSEMEMLHHLEARNFRIWQWNGESFQSCSSTSPVRKQSVFYPIDKAMNNFSDLEIVAHSCEFPLVSQAMEYVHQIEQVIDKSNSQLNDLLSRIIIIILELSRMIRIPTESSLIELKSQLSSLSNQLKQVKLWISEEQEKLFSNALELLIQIDANKFAKKKHKITILKERINASTELDSLAVVVQRKNEIDKCRDYWSNLKTQKTAGNVSFYTVSEIVESGLFYSPSEIIVCGWLGHEKMNRIMSSCFSSKITLLLYPYELKWYKHAKERWSKLANYNIRLSEFPQVMIREEKKPEVVPQDVPEETDNEIEEFELRMHYFSNSQYVASADTTDGVKARMVRFTGNYFSFCTETYGLHVVTDLLKGNMSQSDVPKKVIDEINHGDFVLFRDSDNDIIREIADIALKKNGLYYHRKRAAQWQNALTKKYESFNQDINKLLTHLRLHGCKRHIATIRNWLFNERIIGPGNYSDLAIIAKATENEQFNADLPLIEESISQLRSAHLQAASYLQKSMLADVKSRIDRHGFDQDMDSNISFNLEGLGQVFILEVEEIGSEWLNIGTGWTNKLIKQEDIIWRG